MAITLTRKQFKKELNEMWISVVGLPAICIVLCLIGLALNDYSVAQYFLIIGIGGFGTSLFLAFIVWSGSGDLRRTVKKRISMARNAIMDLDAIEALINEQKPYILYLRDYLTGESAHTTSMVKMPSFVGGYTQVKKEGSHRMEEVTSYLRESLPIVMLHNSRDKSTKYAGHVLYCSNRRWFRNFKILAEHASVVVLDYAKNFEKSRAIIREIDYVVENNLPVVVVGRSSELTKLRKLGIRVEKNSTIKVVKRSDKADGFIVRDRHTEVVLIPESLDQRIKEV